MNIKDLHTVYCEMYKVNTEKHRSAVPNTNEL